MSHGTPTQPMQKGQGANPHAGMTTMRPATPGTPPPASMAVKADLNDVEYDAYLANDRTLADPEIVRVAPGGMVRLRLINGAASTNFFIDLGAIQGELIAVDGMPVRPIQGNRFESAVAQRLDIRIKLPPGQGAYPVLAVREGDIVRTGVVLATKDARVVRIEEKGPKAASVVGLALERRLVAVEPLAVRNIDRTLALDLTGDMAKYIWTLNGKRYGEHSPLSVRRGERVAIVMRNLTEMSHPMHLHGHHFQVVELGRQRVQGAMRDTVIVPANGGRVTVAFDTDNVGEWMLHCHNLYHMAAGMMTTVKYEA
jgi:FtsP/CotA-like multicopper oxidase with cupredoxin domain